MKRFSMVDGLVFATLIAVLATSATTRSACAQSSSLLGIKAAQAPLTLSTSSWTYQAPPEPKQWKLNDFVTVLIEEKVKTQRDGKIDQYKKVEGAATLSKWVTFDESGDIEPDPQSAGSPGVATAIDNKYRAQANMANSDSMVTSIQCTIMDIRPNGTLVIEGHAKVASDDEEWLISLSGIIQADDIMPNGSVKSEKIAEKQIIRQTSGHGRDGIRRGWLQRVLDKFQPI